MRNGLTIVFATVTLSLGLSPPVSAQRVTNIHIWEDGGKMVAEVGQGPPPGEVPTYTLSCPGDPPVTMMFVSGSVGIAPLVPKNDLSPDGKSFAGADTLDTPGMKRRAQYTFRVSP